MNKSIKAGIFAIVVIIILFAGWIWLAGIEFKKPGYEVVIKFSDVTGLKVNDPVRVGGVEKGNVKKITYIGASRRGGMVGTDPRVCPYIEVKVMMENDVILYSDANAEILDVAMISGTKYMKLHPGTSGVLLKPGTIIEGKPSIGLPISILGDIGEKVNELLFAVNTSDLINSVGSTLKSLQTTVDELADMMKESKEDIEITAINAKKISIRLDNTLSNVDTILARIKTGKGTLGQLATNDTVYRELTATLSSVRELVQDIKLNPRKYFKLF